MSIQKMKDQIEETKIWVRMKRDQGLNWCRENKETLAVLAPVVGGALINVVKISIKRSNLRDERALKERFIYDRSNGHYYELKRTLKSKEWMQIEARKANGESLGWILHDMRVLK